MFDISFSELLVIAVVALLVIGPEKLPKVARTMGAFLGRLQRYTTQIKDEVNREMRFEELQKLQQEVQHGAQQVEAGIQSQFNAMDLSNDGSSERGSSEQGSSALDSNAGVLSPTENAAATVSGDIVAVVNAEAAKTAAVKTAKKRTSKPKSVDSSSKPAILNPENTSISTKNPRVKKPSVV